MTSLIWRRPSSPYPRLSRSVRITFCVLCVCVAWRDVCPDLPSQSDGSNPMISHVAEQTVHRIKQGMTRADIGYTPQSMVPLYARLTLIEQNGEPLPPKYGILFSCLSLSRLAV